MQARQIGGANPDVMDSAFAVIARGLRIQVNAARSDFHEDVAGAAEIAVKIHLGA